MNRGFLTITITILLSVLLLFLVFSLTYPSFNLYFSLLEENKAFQSRVLAETCAEIVLLKILQNQSYQGNETITFDENFCQVFPVENSTEGKIIKIKSYFLNFPSYLKVIFDLNSRKIKSWNWEKSF